MKTAHRGLTPDGKMSFARSHMETDAKPLEDAINDLINKAAEDRARSDVPRTYLGGSRLGVGESCLRQLAYEYREARDIAEDMGNQARAGFAPANQRMRFPGKLLRVFRDGHRIEEQAAADLRAAGFQLLTNAPDGRQYGFGTAQDEHGQPRIKGHIDGVFTGGPLPIGYPCLWEMKSMNNKKWTLCKDKGVRTSHPVYYYQMQLYMGYMELTAHPAWFTAYNKDISEYLHQFIPFVIEDAQRASDWGAAVLDADEPEDLPMGGHSTSAPPCRWCDFQDRCWNPKPADVTAAHPSMPEWLKPGADR